MTERIYGYDIGAITREIQAQYLRDAEGNLSGEHLHPRTLLVLVESLEQFTDELVEKAAKHPGPAFGAWGGTTQPGSSDPGTARDMVRWRERLAGYRHALDNCLAAPGMEELVACAMVPVTEPLLLGWHPGQSQQTVPDFVTPWVLANAYGVSQGFADESWARFLEDMGESWPAQLAGKSWDVMTEFSPVALLADIATSAAKGELLGRAVVVAGVVGLGAYVFRRPLGRLLRGGLR